MPKFAYANGSYVPHDYASVHIEDRGFQFADGVYEVIACIDKELADERGHLDRLERSLHEIGMPMPIKRKTLQFIMRELLRKNRLSNANIYIQITRGVVRRDFAFPAEEIPQSIILTAWPMSFNQEIKGIHVITTPDLRWKRRDIKSVALLPQVLAKQKAYNQGCTEAWMIDDSGYITEGSSSNAWIIDDKGKLITRGLNNEILNGVTRTAIFEICHDLNIEIEERTFKVEEAYQASEAFCSSATALIKPVLSIDKHSIGNSKPGKITQEIYKRYRDYVKRGIKAQIAWNAEGK
jgi:D-alanine transaminase